MKKKMVYWLCEQASTTHEARLKLLASKGYGVIFFNEIRSLLNYYNKKRVSIIILGDDRPVAKTISSLKILVNLPNFYGIRLILTVSQNSHDPVIFAYQEGVRDIIPFDLSNDQWVRRFIFSTSSSPSRFVLPEPQLSFKSNLIIQTPCRVIWFGPSKLRIETRIDAPRGSRLILVGSVPEALGLDSLELIVERREKKNLQYRYSDAYECNFSLAKADHVRTTRLIRTLKSEQQVVESIRVFAVVRSKEWRQFLYQHLKSPRYHIATALSKSHITTEPKYLTPQLAFIDAEFIKGPDMELFENLASELPGSTPIVILGPREGIEDLEPWVGGRRLYHLPQQIDEGFLDLIENQILFRIGDSTTPPGCYNIMITSVFSHGDIQIQCRLGSIHPEGGRFLTPLRLGNFAMTRLDSPIWRKAAIEQVLGKVIHSFSHPHLGLEQWFMTDFLFANLTSAGRQFIAEKMLAHLKSGLSSQQISQPKETKSKQSSPLAFEQPDYAKAMIRDLIHDQSPDLALPEAIPVTSETFPRNLSFPDEPIPPPPEDFRIDRATHFDYDLNSSLPSRIPLAKKKPLTSKDIFFKFIFPFMIAITFVSAMGISIYWLARSQGPTKSGQVYSREFEKIRNRNSSDALPGDDR